jgi:long-chain acyl-CoA synthetase
VSVLTSDNATTRGAELALADDVATMTFAELDRRVNQAVHGLRSLGVYAGDTIAVVAGNCNDWFVTAIACANSGITFVPVNWHLVAPEIAYILSDCGAKAVVCDYRYTDVVAAALDDHRVAIPAVVIGQESAGRFVGFEDLLKQSSSDEPDGQSFGGPMFYTSGTTGSPKGVRGSLSAMPAGTTPEVWQLIGGGFASMMRVPGVTALCGPVYHSAQWAFSFLPMMAGSATVMQHKYDSAGLLDLIDRYQATNVHLVPTQMKRLVDLPSEVKARFSGSSLELVLHGAAPCPPAVKRSMIEWWGPKITEYYGSTEGSVITMISAEEWLAKGGSVGRAVPSMEVLVVGDDGARRTTGEEGTLYFRNSAGSDFEYHNAPEKTEAAHLEPGVYLDAEGYLWLSDRKLDMIISGGVNIYPAEIEGVLGGHPLVGDVAVIGVPNDEYGEEVKAIVVPNDGVVGNEALVATLIAHCREQLAGFKCPRSFDFVEDLPRTGTGKIQKRKLRDAYWAEHERRI